MGLMVNLTPEQEQLIKMSSMTTDGTTTIAKPAGIYRREAHWAEGRWELIDENDALTLLLKIKSTQP